MPSQAFPLRTLGNGRGAMAGTIVRAKSPLRVSFAGGGTDLPHYYEKHGGAVLSSTINRYAYVNLHPRDDREISIRSLDMDHMVKYHLDERPIYDGALDLVKAAIQRMGLHCGVDLNVRTDAPPGSGLGGSSALTAAVIGALASLNGLVMDPYELAELNYTIERNDLRISGGKQDQYETTFGGFTFTEFARDQVIVNSLRIDRDIINDLEAHLLLCYTGRVRVDLGLIDKQINLYNGGHPDAIEGTKALHKLAYKMKDVLLSGRLDEFGDILHESYVNKKRVNPHITAGTPADMLYDEARKHGASGGKLLGAGGGGYLMLYCETGRVQEVRRTLEGLGGQFTDFAFDGLGLQVWRSKWK
jgi:D-glycero-alpha-D-manno-heptose-7-phosphate kinase